MIRFKTNVFLFLLLFLLANCSKDQLNTDMEPNMEPEMETVFTQLEGNEPGWVRIKFKDLDDPNNLTTRQGEVDARTAKLDEVARLLGATKNMRVFNEGGKFKKRREKYQLHLWYDFYVGEKQLTTRSMTTLSDLSFVDIVELIPVEKQSISAQEQLSNSMANLSANLSASFSTNESQSYGCSAPLANKGTNFNDPLLTRQWHYYNDGSTPSSIAGADANIFPAWKVTTGNPAVIVAVVDGGIDFNHPDLAQNMWINTKEIAGNGLDDDNNGYIDDIHGFRWGREGVAEPSGTIFPMDHGSHCAGTIAAVNNNGVGLAGIAGGDGTAKSGIRLMSCQTYIPDPDHPDDPHGNSKSTSQTPDAFAFAADNGAVIASCSFSYSGTTLSAAYKAAIDYFVDNAGTDENGRQTGPMKGGLMVAAAGNDGELLAKYPASYEKVISVAYSMSNYQKSRSSNYGPSIDVTAPGGATSSSYAPNREGGVYSTIPLQSINFNAQQGYSYKSGTSMAAPHVSGIAALVLSAAVENNIDMTVAKLRNIIERSCWSLDQYNPDYKGMLGHGQVDAGFAVQILLGGDKQPVSHPTNVTTSSDNTTIKVEWNIPADFFEKPIVTTEVFISLKSLQNVDFEKIPAGVKREIIENKKKVGEMEQKIYSDLNPGTEYHIALIVNDRQRQKSTPTLLSIKTKGDAESPTPDGDSLFKVYPSPVKENLFINFPEALYGRKVEMEIYNATGYRVYKSERIADGNAFNINVEGLTAGVYTVYLKCFDIKEKHTIIKQ